MKPRSVIKWMLLSLPLLLIMGVGMLILSARTVAPPSPTPIPTWLPANSQTNVEMTPGSASHLYSFTAPSATLIKLDSQTPGFAFAAQIHNAAGQTVATFDNLLQEVQLTLLADSGAYQIAVSADDPQKIGTISLALGNAVIAPQTLDGTAFVAPNCRVTNAVGVNVLVRSAPSDQYAVLGSLPASGSLPVIGHTDNNWYTVDFSERQGWISGDVLALAGDCKTLPLVRNPAIPSAPPDAQAFLVQVDRDASGTFHDAISAPDGDISDLIWVRIINLDTNPPNNYREFALTLDCKGTGVASVRWGDVNAPSLSCGGSIVLPFLSGNAQVPITVQFPKGSPQSYVDYTLSILPAHPVG